MNIQNEREKPRFQFFFKDAESDPSLEKSTNLKLVQLLALAPPSASATGFVERSDRAYLAALEMRSPYRVFAERAVGLSPREAVNRVLRKMEDRLYRWRFGGDPNSAPLRSPAGFSSPQPQA